MEWIDFSFASLSLTAGNNYYVAFSFTDPSNQNFFYENDNVTWTQDVFTQLDGAEQGNAGNTVVPAIRGEQRIGGCSGAWLDPAGCSGSCGYALLT